MRTITCIALGLSLGVLPLPARALSDQEARELIEEVRSLRRIVEDQNRRIADLESKAGAFGPGERTALQDEAPSSESLGATAPAAGSTEPAPAGAVIRARQGAQAQIGVIFDGTYTGGKNMADDAEFRGVELAVGASVDPYFDLYANLAFTPDEVAVEEGYVTAHLPWNFQARLGRELLPFGDLNTLHLHDQPQVDDPQALTQFFGPEGINGVGGHLEWLAPFAVNPTLSLAVGAYNRATGEANTAASDRDGDGNPDAPDMFLDAGAFNVRDRERGPLWLGRATSYYEWDAGRHAIRVGGSYLSDENDVSGATRTTVAGLDAKYRWRPDATGRGLAIAGEYLQHRRQESPTTLLLATGGNDLSNNGGYMYGQYDFGKRWSLGYRYDRTNTVFSSSSEITSNSVYGEFRPTEFSRLRAQYRHDDRNFDGNGNGVLTDDDADVFMLQFTHLIGWHPAHKY